MILDYRNGNKKRKKSRGKKKKSSRWKVKGTLSTLVIIIVYILNHRANYTESKDQITVTKFKLCLSGSEVGGLVGKVFTLHMANLSSIPSTPYNPGAHQE